MPAQLCARSSTPTRSPTASARLARVGSRFDTPRSHERSSMELSTIEMDPHAARRAYLEYKRGLVAGAHKRLGEAERRYRQVDEAAARGYKALAAGRRLLKLSETMAAGGTQVIPSKAWNGTSFDVHVPRL